MIERQGCRLGVRKQCSLLAVNRSSLYYEPKGISQETIALMQKIDEQYTKTPFYGVDKMTEELNRQGLVIGHNRLRNLLRKMGLRALYPKPKTSKPSPEQEIYPYLLRDVDVVRPNQVWSADITYIRMKRGFVYLVAIVDWYSRYAVSWSLSRSLEADFCIAALDEALGNPAVARPEIFNTDQGSQFTSSDFTGRLKDAKVAISMDGRGRVFDNIFTERLWRTVKYEEVYLKDYRSFEEAREGIGAYMRFYNHERLHQSLGYRTPAEVYLGNAAAPKEPCAAARNDAADTAMAVSACEGMAFYNTPGISDQ